MPSSSVSAFTRACFRGMDAATRMHNALKVDTLRPIDIFAVLQQQKPRLWIMFQPLDALYGVCLYREKHPEGILINVKHPHSLQRFTAAHEFGHIALRHGPTIDGEEQIFPTHPSSSLQEVEAQTFAAHFLMPIQLVNRTLKHLGLPLKPHTMSEHDVYQLSLRLGASYLAVVNHLVSLKKLDQNVARELRKKQPKQMKSLLRHTITPGNERSDVWRFDERDYDMAFTLGLNDEVHVYLPEQQYTDNIQVISLPDRPLPLTLDEMHVELVTRANQQAEQQLVYAWHFVLRAEYPGEADIYIDNNKYALVSQKYRLRLRVLAQQEAGLLNAQKEYL